MGLLAGTVFDRPPHCERCDQLESDCECAPEAAVSNLVPPDLQRARLSVENRKKGKIVTMIRGLAAAENDFPKLLTVLKTLCGAGGKIEGDTLEIQGDQFEKLKKKLCELGYKVH